MLKSTLPQIAPYDVSPKATLCAKKYRFFTNFFVKIQYTYVCQHLSESEFCGLQHGVNYIFLSRKLNLAQRFEYYIFEQKIWKKLHNFFFTIENANFV